MSRNKQPHGRPGHLNLSTLDECSVITGFGKHARVVAFLPKTGGLYCRVDRPRWIRFRYGDSQYPELPDPTPEQVLTVARKHSWIRGRWKLRDVIEWDNGGTLHYYFDPA